MTKATASQLASDLRNAHTRNRDTLRIKGIREGEIWEAEWGQLQEDKTGYYVWLRLKQ